jgi:hypothetical protein
MLCQSELQRKHSSLSTQHSVTVLGHSENLKFRKVLITF